MRRATGLAMVLPVLAGACGLAGETPPLPRAAGTLALYDTVTPAGLGESVPDLAAGGKWTRATGGPIGGDAVLVNDSIGAVIRRDGGVDLYARGSGGWNRRARLSAVHGKEPAGTAALKAVAGNGEAVAVEAKLAGGGDAAVVFSLGAGEPILKATPQGAVDALRIAAPCRLGVLPDFFADDLLIDARAIPVDRAEIPSENVFLQMAGGGEAIVAALWEKNEQDVQVALSGKGDGRTIVSADIFFSPGGSIWTAVLEQKGIWYSREFGREDGIKGVVLADWEVPFAAKWKGNFMREDRNSESMQFSPARKNGKLTAALTAEQRDAVEMGQEKPEWARDYATKYVGLQGVGVIYPMSRSDDTPPDRLCVDDLLRMSLGTGPCESVLDLAARKPTSKGIFTCSYGGTMGRLFSSARLSEGELAERHKEERYFLRRVNANMLVFVKNVQDRINVYVNFGNELMKYLDEQEKKEPAQAELAARIREEWAKPVWQYGKPLSNSTPCDNEQRAREYLKEMQKALAIDTPEQALKAGEAHKIPHDLGDPGDRRLRNLRRKVLLIRSMATMEMATNPATGQMAKEIRARTDAALRNPFKYENATVW